RRRTTNAKYGPCRKSQRQQHCTDEHGADYVRAPQLIGGTIADCAPCKHQAASFATGSGDLLSRAMAFTVMIQPSSVNAKTAATRIPSKMMSNQACLLGVVRNNKK